MQVAHPATVPRLQPSMQSHMTPTTSKAGGSISPTFRITPRPQHGNGAVAVRPILRGELILVEQPLVVQDSDTRTAQSILSNLCRHPTTLTQAYLNLHNAFGEQVDPILGIFNSNSIPLAPVEPVPNPPGSILAYGVFLQLSRFNNSCSPNASITWDERKSQITVHALQPIPAGSEITVCYGQPLFATRSERRDYLQRTMGFRCTCSCCSLSDEASRASDARRTELWRLFKAVPFLGHDAAAGIRAATQALQTLQTEGLYLYQDSFAYEAYQFCMLLKGADEDGRKGRRGRSPTAEAYGHHAMQWLERAYQWKVVTSGRESDGALFFAQIMGQHT